jgi:aminoglycoside 3-N-acetyltransferase
MPVDNTIGILAETLRQHPKSDGRSTHPILSFTGINVSPALENQSVSDPLAPLEWLYQQNGYVVLIGTDHTANTSIHYAEKLAGLQQFTRWALTASGVMECPGFPGCSRGFDKAEPVLRDITREVRVGNARVRSLPIQPMVAKLVDILQENPLALLCEDHDCLICNDVRKAISSHSVQASTDKKS